MLQKELKIQQRQQIKLIKDYDFVIDYYSGKFNVVADTDIKEEIKLKKFDVQIRIGPEVFL